MLALKICLKIKKFRSQSVNSQKKTRTTMNTLTFFVLGISLRETESQLRRENNNFSSFRNLAHVLDSSTSYSFKDVGQLHNQIAEQLHTKMLEHPPSTEEEYLDMVLQQTIESFCLPDDIDCRINQENYFYETRDVMMSEYDKSNDSRRRLFINQYPEIQTYFDRIVDYLTSITLENKEEQLDKIRKISNDIESSNATETTVSVVQGVASVAVSSTEFWTEHLMNPKSAYFMFIREILEKVGLVESDNFEIVSVSKLCMTRLAISIVFWDVFGAIRYVQRNPWCSFCTSYFEY